MTKTTSIKVILKFIYNTYFNKIVIKIRDDNRHTKIVINDEIIEMYNFGKTYLKCFVNNEIKSEYDPFDDEENEYGILEKSIIVDEIIDMFPVINMDNLIMMPHYESNVIISDKKIKHIGAYIRPETNFFITFDE